MMTTSDRPTSTTSRRVAYSLAAGAVAAAATDAEATIVYSGPQEISIGSGFSQNLDLNGDATRDLALSNYVFAGGPYQGAFVPFAPGSMVGFSANSLLYVRALGLGDVISQSTISAFLGSLAFGPNNPNAEFNNVTDAYIGLGFPISGVNHFGWVRVSINNAQSSFIVHDWAYDATPGRAITAGAIPEPNSMALGLLAAGAAGVLALRRQAA